MEPVAKLTNQAVSLPTQIANRDYRNVGFYDDPSSIISSHCLLSIQALVKEEFGAPETHWICLLSLLALLPFHMDCSGDPPGTPWLTETSLPKLELTQLLRLFGMGPFQHIFSLLSLYNPRYINQEQLFCAQESFPPVLPGD